MPVSPAKAERVERLFCDLRQVDLREPKGPRTKFERAVAWDGPLRPQLASGAPQSPGPARAPLHHTWRSRIDRLNAAAVMGGSSAKYGDQQRFNASTSSPMSFGRSGRRTLQGRRAKRGGKPDQPPLVATESDQMRRGLRGDVFRSEADRATPAAGRRLGRARPRAAPGRTRPLPRSRQRTPPSR